MGSIGQLRPIIHTTGQQQQQQPQQHQQPIDMKPNLITGNNILHSPSLPTTNDYMNDLLITSTNSATAPTTITTTITTTNALSDNENDDINNLMVPKSLNFIIDKLSKVREEVITIGKCDQEKNTCSMSNGNLEQDVENNHNISNSNDNGKIVKEHIATFMNNKQNTSISDSKKNYNENHSNSNKGHKNIKSYDKNQSCQDTNNNSSDSTLSQNEMSSSSTSPTSSKSSASSSHSVSLCLNHNEATQNKDIMIEDDSHSHKSKTSNYQEGGKEDEEDEDETIDVDDLTISSMKTNDKSFPIVDNNNDTSSTNMFKDDCQKPIENHKAETLSILEQLMDKRNELNRLDKLVFDLITHHLMKITPTNISSIEHTLSKSIHPTSYNHRPVSPSIANYNNHSSSDKDCRSSNLRAISGINLNVEVSTRKKKELQQCTSSAGYSNSKYDTRSLGDYHINQSDYISSTKNTSSPNDLNSIESTNGNKSLIDLTTASSRQHRNTSTPNYDSATSCNKQSVSYQPQNTYLSPPKDSNFFLARHKLSQHINLSEYDGLPEALKLTNSIYGHSRDSECSSEASKCSVNSTNDCTSLTGLNLKTTGTNTKISTDDSLSLLKINNHSAQSHLPMASTSYNLHALSGLHNSPYQLNLNSNNGPIIHHNSTLNLLNKHLNVNPSSVTTNNEFGLNYSSQNREQSLYATPYKTIDTNPNCINSLDHGTSKSSHPHGESLLRPPANKKFRTSFSQQPITMTSSSIINSNLDENQQNKYLYDHGSLDYHHQQSLSRQDLDLQHKHIQKLLQQQMKNSTILTATTAPPPSPSPSSSLLAYQQQYHHHNQRQYQRDSIEPISSEQNNNNDMKSNSNSVENNNSNTNGINNNNGTCRLVCHVCSSGFEDRHRLQQHLSIHLQLKPEWYTELTIKETMTQYEAKRGDYLCGQCDLRYDTTLEFDKHMQTHGDKPHKCELCFHDNSFRHWRQYLTHFRNHCFVYHCRFVKGCEHQCNRRDYLKSHILKHHLDNRLPE